MVALSFLRMKNLKLLRNIDKNIDKYINKNYIIFTLIKIILVRIILNLLLFTILQIITIFFYKSTISIKRNNFSCI